MPSGCLHTEAAAMPASPTGHRTDVQPQGSAFTTHFCGAPRAPVVKNVLFYILFCLYQSLREARIELLASWLWETVSEDVGVYREKVLWVRAPWSRNP